ncbi:MAG: glycosyltransferase family 2 protein [Elusimicrobiota bacterium]|nr:glycosyltransferase family 2 protein [Endomicrobiia bacterium]MDW8166336.1 glycosyltransferase family 2 protein [Elusimicrobiota bacterium]
MEKIKISAVILTFNEEKKIECCLKSLSWVDEIIVVDSYSADATLEICNKYQTKIFKRKFDNFSSQRNFAISKATGDWIIMVDADEEITKELAYEIKETLQKYNDIDGYYIPRLNISFGKLLRYGMNSPDYTFRLFKRDKVKYMKEVHEIPIITSEKVGYLKHPIIHRNYQSISEYLPKLNFYTDLEAKEMLKNKQKISWLRIIFFPIIRFIWSYFIKNGWRDGFAGFLMSLYGSIYMITKYLKYKELTKNKKCE